MARIRKGVAGHEQRPKKNKGVIFQAAVIFLFFRKQFLLCQKEQGQGLLTPCALAARIEAGFLFLGSLKVSPGACGAHTLATISPPPGSTKKVLLDARRSNFYAFLGVHVLGLENSVVRSHICGAHHARKSLRKSSVIAEKINIGSRRNTLRQIL
jgi:hypothetical protein